MLLRRASAAARLAARANLRQQRSFAASAPSCRQHTLAVSKGRTVRHASAVQSAGETMNRRWLSATSAVPPDGKRLLAPPMVYISGEEMTRYCAQLVLEQWIEPFIDTSNWQYFDMSCKSRDDSNDQVLDDAVAAGKKLCAIFKEPTITPTVVQQKRLGLKKAWGSPNGAMRRGWNGITISRDTIHIDGIELGFKKPVLFERHAVGGEYGAGFKIVGKGKLRTIFQPDDGAPIVVDERRLDDEETAAVTYTNPYENVTDLARIFFDRCLVHKCTPYIVTKKTVFKWQELFWTRCKKVFDEEYKERFATAGLLDSCQGDLQHLISDAATMQIIRWTDGGFGMACHNYDGDMLTDEVAQCHRSPGFITSNLIGKREDGTMIKEFEASHGTVTDMWNDHLAGKPTSFNPLGMVEALIGAMQHAAKLDTASKYDSERVARFANALRSHIHAAIVDGDGTRDICGPNGLTTEEFISNVAGRLAAAGGRIAPPRFKQQANHKHVLPDVHVVDLGKAKELFDDFDADGSGSINFEEFVEGVGRLGVLPKKDVRSKPPDV